MITVDDKSGIADGESDDDDDDDQPHARGTN